MKKFREAEDREAKERGHNALDAMNRQATKEQDEIIRTRETLERLHEEQNKTSASAASASTDVPLFHRDVQEGIRVRGGMIKGDWKGAVLNRMGGVTPNETAGLF